MISIVMKIDGDSHFIEIGDEEEFLRMPLSEYIERCVMPALAMFRQKMEEANAAS